MAIKKVYLTNEEVRDTFQYSTNTGRLSFYFVNKSGERYYYKANNKYSFSYNEIMGSILAKAIGIPHVTPSPCFYTHEDGKEYSGVISKDYVKDRATTEIISLYHIVENYNNLQHPTVESIMSALSFYIYQLKQKGFDAHLDDNMENHLKKMALFMYVTGQQDFNFSNIEFISTKENDGSISLKLAPFFDHSICFYNMLHDYVDNSKIRQDPKYEISKLKFFMMLTEDNHDIYSYKRIIRELGVEIATNPQIKDLFGKIYKLDFQKEIELYLKENPEVTLQNVHMERAVLYFENSKEMLAEMVERLDKNYMDELKSQKVLKPVELKKPIERELN